tara:strand:- start:381 stop:692 length:312 start_codon:yes stop_codon:yes gene_type:complete
VGIVAVRCGCFYFFKGVKMRRAPPSQLKNRNLVAKHAHKFNKNQVHKDKHRETKRGYVKHKGKHQSVSEQMQDELEPIVRDHPTQHDESDELELIKKVLDKKE